MTYEAENSNVLIFTDVNLATHIYTYVFPGLKMTDLYPGSKMTMVNRDGKDDSAIAEKYNSYNRLGLTLALTLDLLTGLTHSRTKALQRKWT